jgi:hypothetical protein
MKGVLHRTIFRRRCVFATNFSLIGSENYFFIFRQIFLRGKFPACNLFPQKLELHSVLNPMDLISSSSLDCILSTTNYSIIWSGSRVLYQKFPILTLLTFLLQFFSRSRRTQRAINFLIIPAKSPVLTNDFKFFILPAHITPNHRLAKPHQIMSINPSRL